MMRRLIPAAACVVLVTGCSFETKWRDTSGQKRDQAVARADVAACKDVAGYKDLNQTCTGADIGAFATKSFSCMTDRGWEQVVVGEKT